MSLQPSRALLFVSALCFAVALLGALGAFNGVQQQDWVAGGALALALGLAL